MSEAIANPKILIVEGLDEKHLFSALIKHLVLTDIEIRDIGGKDNIRRNVRALKITPGFEKATSLGVVRDADNDPHSAFQSVCDALQDAGLPRPSEPLQPTGNAPQVTVMILPDGKTTGMLEDICLESVNEDPAMHCVEEYFQCLDERLENLPNNPSKARVRAFLASREWLEEAHFEYLQTHLDDSFPESPVAPSTAMVHTFLASRYKPGLALGVAAQEGYWPFNHHAFDLIKQFLEML